MSALEGYVEGMINLGGGGGGGSNVTIEPTLETGTKIADYTVDETSGELYAPTPVTYTAGENVQISEQNVISATDTTYSAGDGISINNGVISATGGGANITIKPCYAEFVATWKNSYIDTLIGQTDWEMELDFYINSYQNNGAILGNTNSSSRIHLTMYNDRWYTSNGSSEINFSYDGMTITGRHTFIWNRISDRKILYDNVEVGTCNGTENGDITILLNYRAGADKCYLSRIYRFKGTNRNGDVMFDFRPVAIYSDNTLIYKGFIDFASGMSLSGWYNIVEIQENEE